MENQQNSTKKFLMGAILGLAIGLAIGLIASGYFSNSKLIKFDPEKVGIRLTIYGTNKIKDSIAFAQGKTVMPDTIQSIDYQTNNESINCINNYELCNMLNVQNNPKPPIIENDLFNKFKDIYIGSATIVPKESLNINGTKQVK